ncbi:MAG: phage protease [Planctomycetota bacterium]
MSQSKEARDEGQPGNPEDVLTAQLVNNQAIDADHPPRKILVAPWGQVESTNGDFTVDEESIRLAIEAFQSHNTDVPIDYEHQTLGGPFASPSGKAPAAGWIKKLTGRCGLGLMAEIEWTTHATAMLSEKEYRYLSPVVLIRKIDRKLIAVHSAALTNKPAIVGMQPIVNHQDPGAREVQRKALCETLALDENVHMDRVLELAAQRIRELGHQAEQREIEACVRRALEAGKLMPCQVEWAGNLIRRDRALFDEWVKNAPVVIASGKLSPPDRVVAPAGRQVRDAAARSEYRAHAWLADITSEDAFVRFASPCDQGSSAVKQ